VVVGNVGVTPTAAGSQAPIRWQGLPGCSRWLGIRTDGGGFAACACLPPSPLPSLPVVVGNVGVTPTAAGSQAPIRWQGLARMARDSQHVTDSLPPLSPLSSGGEGDGHDRFGDRSTGSPGRSAGSAGRRVHWRACFGVDSLGHRSSGSPGGSSGSPGLRWGTATNVSILRPCEISN
jgi:hypothetical protein